MLCFDLLALHSEIFVLNTLECRMFTVHARECLNREPRHLGYASFYAPIYLSISISLKFQGNRAAARYQSLPSRHCSHSACQSGLAVAPTWDSNTIALNSDLIALPSRISVLRSTLECWMFTIHAECLKGRPNKCRVCTHPLINPFMSLSPSNPR